MDSNIEKEILFSMVGVQGLTESIRAVITVPKEISDADNMIKEVIVLAQERGIDGVMDLARTKFRLWDYNSLRILRYEKASHIWVVALVLLEYVRGVSILVEDISFE